MKFNAIAWGSDIGEGLNHDLDAWFATKEEAIEAIKQECTSHEVERYNSTRGIVIEYPDAKELYTSKDTTVPIVLAEYTSGALRMYPVI